MKLRDLLTPDEAALVSLDSYKADVDEIHAPIFEIEDRLVSTMPGDDVTRHPLHDGDVSWYQASGFSFLRLRRMIENGEVPPEQMDRAMEAYHALSEGQRYRKPGEEPEAPPPNLPRDYREYRFGLTPHDTDTDLHDMTGITTTGPYPIAKK